MRQLLLALIFCTGGLLSSVHAETLSLQQALVLGMEHNFDLRIASLEVERAEAGIMGEEGRFDITAELGFGLSRSETPLASSADVTEDSVSAEEIRAEAALGKSFASGLQARLSLTGTQSDADALADQLDPAYRTYLLLDLTQPLLKDLGADINTANLQIAHTRRQQAALGYLDQAQQLIAEIEQAYLTLAQAEAEYRYAALARELAAELLDGNLRKVDAGLVPVSEVNEARSAVAGREEGLLLAQQQATLARNRLLALIDHGDAQLPADWQTILPELVESNVPDVALALQIALRQRPDIQQARLELDSRKIALVYADNQLLPRLDLKASLGVNGLSGNDDDNDSRYRGAWQNSFGRALEQDGNNWYAGVRFSMPLQNRVAKAHYRDAAAQDKQSLHRLRRAEVAAEEAIRSAHARLTLGHKRLLVTELYAELAQTTLEQESRRLQEGLSDTFRVLTFQNALVTARIRQAVARTDYALAQASLYQAMGTNLERYNIVAALPLEGAMP